MLDELSAVAVEISLYTPPPVNAVFWSPESFDANE
jgi:hypothetical protein